MDDALRDIAFRAREEDLRRAEVIAEAHDGDIVMNPAYLFPHELTRAEVNSIHRHLHLKWFGTELPEELLWPEDSPE